MNKNKTIWILWWMWPWASAEIYTKIIQYCQREYWAIQDIDYPPVIINSLTLEWFDETGIIDSELVKIQLIKWVQTLENAGSDFIIIACNTVHIFDEDMQQAITKPIISLIDATVGSIINNNLKKVWLLSSETTNKLWLYSDAFEKEHIDIINCTNWEQKIVNNVIANVMAWIHSDHDVFELKCIIDWMTQKWAWAIVLWCTELPLAINQKDVGSKIYSTVDIIVEKSVDYALWK